MENKKEKTYKVNIYLGKELYEKLESISLFLGVSVSQTAKILLNTGVEFSKALENKTLNSLNSEVKNER